MSSAPIPTLYIGSGPISNYHIPAAISNGFMIKYITSRHNSVRCQDLSRKYGLESSYYSHGWQKALDDESLTYSAVIIAVDTKVTPEILRKVCQKGLPVLVEKPVGWHPNQLTEIQSEFPENKIFVAYNRRFYLTVQKLKHFVETSEPGIARITVPDSIPTVRQFLVNGCHMIDLARYVFGDISLKYKSIIKSPTGEPSGIVAAGNSGSNWQILFECNWGAPDNFAVTVSTTNLLYSLKPIEVLSVYQGMTVQEPTDEIPIRSYSPNRVSQEFEDATYKPGFHSMYSKFRDFALNPTIDTNSCTLNEAIKTLQLCHQMIESLELPVDEVVQL